MTATWMPREQWDRLVRGQDCPMCREMPARMRPDHADRFGRTVEAMDTSVFWLCTDQFSAGYSLVICNRHVAEPHDLPPAEQAAFLSEVMRAGRVIQRALGADKMNYQLLGNSIPPTEGTS